MLLPEELWGDPSFGPPPRPLERRHRPDGAGGSATRAHHPRPPRPLGHDQARWGIGRMSYRVPPGLYAVGEPDADVAGPGLGQLQAELRPPAPRARPAATPGSWCSTPGASTSGARPARAPSAPTSSCGGCRHAGLRRIVAHRTLVAPAARRDRGERPRGARGAAGFAWSTGRCGPATCRPFSTPA